MPASRSLLLLLRLLVLFAHAAAAHAAAVRLQYKSQVQLLLALVAAVAAYDLSRARLAYVAAHPPYEQAQALEHSFAFIDYNIDTRPYVFATREDDIDFRAFHWLECALSRENNLGTRPSRSPRPSSAPSTR